MPTVELKISSPSKPLTKHKHALKSNSGRVKNESLTSQLMRPIPDFKKSSDSFMHEVKLLNRRASSESNSSRGQESFEEPNVADELEYLSIKCVQEQPVAMNEPMFEKSKANPTGKKAGITHSTKQS